MAIPASGIGIGSGAASPYMTEVLLRSVSSPMVVLTLTVILPSRASSRSRDTEHGHAFAVQLDIVGAVSADNIHARGADRNADHVVNRQTP